MSQLPRKWASATNYSSGPDTGTPTRVDPGVGVAKEGLVPDEPVVAQHLNYELGATIDRLYSLRNDFIVDEDFAGAALYDATNSALHGQMTWRTSEDGPGPAVNGNAGNSKNPGQLVVGLPGNATDFSKFAFYLHTATGAPMTYATFEHAEVVVRVNENAGNVTERVQFGLCDDADDEDGGSDSLLVVRSKGGSATKWLLQRRVAGVQTTSTLTSATFADNEFAVWTLTKTDDGDITLALDGATVHTVAAADLPSGGCNWQCYQSVTAADANVLTVTWDRVYVHSVPGARFGA